jgi:hypothetical protein
VARLSVGLVVILLITVSVRAFTNDEYGLEATIPAGLPECVAQIQGHVHGVGTVLVGRDCDNPERHSAFHVWADYNTAEFPNALDVLRGKECSGTRLRWADDEWRGAIGGLKTAICRIDRPDGQVEFRLAAQAGKWPKGFDLAVPHLNYSVNFVSTAPRLDGDLRVLKRFVRSIRVRSPKG